MEEEKEEGEETEGTGARLGFYKGRATATTGGVARGKESAGKEDFGPGWQAQSQAGSAVATVSGRTKNQLRIAANETTAGDYVGRPGRKRGKEDERK